MVRVARNDLTLFARRIRNLGGVDRLRDAAPVLARRTFRARKNSILRRLRDRDLRHRGREAAGGVGAGRKEIEHVDADVTRVAAVAPLHVIDGVMLGIEQRQLGDRAVPLPRRDGDGVLVHAEIREGRRADGAVGRLDVEEVASIDAEPLRRFGMNLDPRAPADLRHRIRELLQPGLIRAASVAEQRRLIGDEEEIPRGAGDRLRGRSSRRRRGARRDGLHRRCCRR